MEKLIAELHDIIREYRSEDGDFMNESIVREWVEQFDEIDHEFIVREMIHILSKRYITRPTFKEYLRTTFFKDTVEVLKRDFNSTDIKDIFVRTLFINEQPEGKSQKAVIGILEEVLSEELGLKLSDCGKGEPACCIYLDDILCTGDTIFKALAAKDGWLSKNTLHPDKSNRTFLEEKNIPLFIVFHSIHKRNVKKLMSRIKYAHQDHKLKIWWFYQDDHEIDNNIGDIQSSMDFLYPCEDTDSNELIMACKKQIEEKITKYCIDNNYVIPKSNFYRSNNLPVDEKLFSSPENRNRFEKVILTKSIELYNKANSSELRMRPLGYGLYTDINFGFGTLLFSWRNIPFNTPLVFWYEHKGWQPLFKRKFSTYKKTLEQILKSLGI